MIGVSRTVPWFSRLMAMLLLASLAACSDKPVPISGFRPLEPAVHNVSDAGDPMSAPSGASLRPLLRWRPFPGVTEKFSYEKTYERAPFVDVEKSAVTNLTYEVRIWDPEDALALVYERRGLRQPEHRVEKRLRPDKVYFWSVRARFEFEAAPQLTEWSMTQLPYAIEEREFFAVSKTKGPRAVARRIGEIPFANYYRFKTPEGKDK